MNITEFLEARIAEDEAVAAPEIDSDHAYYSTPGPYRDDWGLWTYNILPARVLAECAAKRAIVAEHELVPQTYENRRTPRNDVGCNICAEWDGLIVPDGPCRTLRHLAAVYDQHPDYDQAWRNA